MEFLRKIADRFISNNNIIVPQNSGVKCELLDDIWRSIDQKELAIQINNQEHFSVCVLRNFDSSGYLNFLEIRITFYGKELDFFDYLRGSWKKSLFIKYDDVDEIVIEIHEYDRFETIVSDKNVFNNLTMALKYISQTIESILTDYYRNRYEVFGSNS
jgi:hypothetical protein